VEQLAYRSRGGRNRARKRSARLLLKGEKVKGKLLITDNRKLKVTIEEWTIRIVRPVGKKGMPGKGRGPLKEKLNTLFTRVLGQE